MTKVVGLRELARNIKMLQQYDYVEIKDKKTHEFKGIFVSAKYAKEFEEFLKKKIAEKKEQELKKIMQFAGFAEGDTKNMSIQEMKKTKVKKYAEE